MCVRSVRCRGHGRALSAPGRRARHRRRALPLPHRIYKALLTVNPFRPDGEPLQDLFTHEGERERLILPDEEERLFNAAKPHLQALMIAALETSCRVGELLSLQWHRVRFDLNEIHFEPKKTKAC